MVAKFWHKPGGDYLKNTNLTQISKAHEPVRIHQCLEADYHASFTACSDFLFISLTYQCLTSPLRVFHLSQSRRESPPCSSALPNKPERDSLADSCSRWHYYSTASPSAGSGSTTGGGGCPSAVPTRQHQHQHMAVLCNTVSVGRYVAVIAQQVPLLSLLFLWWFDLTKAGFKDRFSFCSGSVCTCR